MISSFPLSLPAMTAGNSYLFSILQKHEQPGLLHLYPFIFQLKEHLKLWAGDDHVETIESGSRAKSTAISLGSDIDYLVSLKSNSGIKRGGLEGIYNSLFRYLGQMYPWGGVRKQNVSIRVRLGTLIGGEDVDVTPAQRRNEYTNDHSLYTSKPNQSHIMTNVHQHILDVAGSGRINEIKLLKIWRQRNNLDFPSIYLEYLLIKKILSDKPKFDLENNIWYVLNALARKEGNPLFESLIDPANSSNVLSNLLDVNQKQRIIFSAQKSLKEGYWEQIIW